MSYCIVSVSRNNKQFLDTINTDNQSTTMHIIVFPELRMILYLLLCLSLLQPIASKLINSSTALHQLLCSNNDLCESLIVLDSSVPFELDTQGEFCIIIKNNSCGNVSRLVIRSNNNVSARVTCLHHSGVAVINANVEFHRVTFEKCGVYLKTLPSDVIAIFNSSQPYYQHSFVAALMLVECVMNFTYVTFNRSKGFDLIAFNPDSKLFERISNPEASLYRNDTSNLGSGVVFHFSDSPWKGNFNRNVLINYFSSTHADLYFSQCQNMKYFTPAATLTIIFAQTKFKVNFVMRKSSFHRISSISNGVIAIYQYNLLSSTAIMESNFTENTVLYPCNIGFGMINIQLNVQHLDPLQKSCLNPLNISDCIFDNGYNGEYHLLSNAGCVSISAKSSKIVLIKLLFKNIQFLNIRGTRNSQSLFIRTYSEKIKTFVTLEGLKVINNSIITENPYKFNGIFVFKGVTYVHFIGSMSSFQNNHGSVIKAIDTIVKLSGQMIFINNNAANGGAIQITGKSRLYFMLNANIFFINNSALLFGGAIYANTNNDIDDDCPFQFENFQNPVATFIGNEARLSGSDAYSVRLLNCHMLENANNTESKPAMLILLLHKMLRISNHSVHGLLRLSTKPVALKKANNETELNSKLFYPGQSLNISLAALDLLNRAVYSSVQIQVYCLDTIQLALQHCKRTWIQFSDQEQLLKENSKYTSLSISVHTNANKPIKVAVGCSVAEVGEAPNLQFYLHPCPLGFNINPLSGSCECSSLIEILNDDKFQVNDNQCSITNQKFSSSHLDSWVGLVEINETTSVFGVCKTCPIGNCNILLRYYGYFSNYSGIFKTTLYNEPSLNHYVPLCTEHHEGLLCGKCENGYSVLLNSKKCKICDDKYMVINILALLAYGPVLISILFVFTLTLSTGTLNGIIFYANMSNIGLTDILMMYSTGSKDLIVCISISVKFLEILNANPVYPDCLFDGMNELWKTAIRLIFQIYLCAIVIALIFLSRRSIWLTRKLGNSSIKVLVTIFHISVSRMLLTLIDVLTCTHVHIETSKDPMSVWFLDGNVHCLTDQHLLLAILTIILVCPLWLVYVIGLLCPRRISKTSFGSKYCRPLIEAIHAPYKQGKEYWFVLRIVLLIYLYTVYAIFRGLNWLLILDITLPVMSAFIVAQVHIKPFKSNIVNVLDLLPMMNVWFLEMTIWYDLPNVEFKIFAVKCVISVFFTMFLLFLIMFHRVLKFFERINFISNLIQNITVTGKVLYRKQKEQRCRRCSIVDSFHQPCDDFREPLLK